MSPSPVASATGQLPCEATPLFLLLLLLTVNLMPSCFCAHNLSLLHTNQKNVKLQQTWIYPYMVWPLVNLMPSCFCAHNLSLLHTNQKNVKLQQTWIYHYPMVWPLPRPWSGPFRDHGLNPPLSAVCPMQKGFFVSGAPFLGFGLADPAPKRYL